jgi:hypothetical protein
MVKKIVRGTRLSSDASGFHLQQHQQLRQDNRNLLSPLLLPLPPLHLLIYPRRNRCCALRRFNAQGSPFGGRLCRLEAQRRREPLHHPP